MSNDYPELDKTLIEIEDDTIEKEEDIFPLIDDKVFEKDIKPTVSLEDIIQHTRKRLISILKRKKK